MVTYAEYAKAGAYLLLATNFMIAAFALLNNDHKLQFQTESAKKLVFGWGKVYFYTGPL
jgi:hypothetical protein